MTTLELYVLAGDHCESGTLVNILKSRGIEISEPMVFGLGQGLSFLYWHSKQMPGPFLGGRVKPDQLIRHAAAALNLDIRESQTSSVAKAEASLIAALDEGDVVGLKLDRYYLDYTTQDFHFPAHYVACIGYADEGFTLVETTPLGIQTTSRQSMAQARSARGPMSSRNLSLRLAADATADLDRLPDACRDAIHATAVDFLNPPINNAGFRGIAKTSDRMAGWSELDNPVAQLHRIGASMERGGTGGGFFRRLWGRFLDEAAEVTQVDAYAEGAQIYYDVAAQWTAVSDLLCGASEQNLKPVLAEASAIVETLARRESSAMGSLERVSR